MHTSPMIPAFAFEEAVEAGRRLYQEEVEINDSFLSAEELARLSGKTDLGSRQPYFNVLSLRCWLAIAKRARVQAVPARLLGTLHKDTIERLFEPHREGAELSNAERAQVDALQTAVDATDPDEMIRTDYCAPFSIKSAMHHGDRDMGYELSENGRRMAPWGDMRVLELMMQYGSPEIPFLARPWIQAVHHVNDAGHLFPVEFRVFVQEAKVIGISNYYPQVSLRESDEILGYAAQAESLAEKMITQMQDLGVRPANAHLLRDPVSIDCTMDFIVRTGGKVLFLEAGPPFGRGAAPCCFQRRLEEGGQISGLALAP